MTLEETAGQVDAKCGEIEEKLREICHLCELVLRREVINSEAFELTQDQKQTVITHYQSKKSELQTLVNQLP